jgi:hypothetical protein
MSVIKFVCPLSRLLCLKLLTLQGKPGVPMRWIKPRHLFELGPGHWSGHAEPMHPCALRPARTIMDRMHQRFELLMNEHLHVDASFFLAVDRHLPGPHRP